MLFSIVELSLIYLFAANSHQINKNNTCLSSVRQYVVCSEYFHVSMHPNMLVHQYTSFLKTVFNLFAPEDGQTLVSHTENKIVLYLDILVGA